MDSFLYKKLTYELTLNGMIPRGGYHVTDDDVFPEDAKTVILIDNSGPEMFHVFSTSGFVGVDALDRWTMNVMEPIAKLYSAEIIFPFGRTRYVPFQQWAMRAEGMESSPLGLLLHPEYGLWHAYRAALVFTKKLKLPSKTPADCICEECDGQPCLQACPVSAFSCTSYDVATCRDHLAGDDREECMRMGCAARRACPVGHDYIYDSEQAAFHMRAFQNTISPKE